jgi:hypothetical protein
MRVRAIFNPQTVRKWSKHTLILRWRDCKSRPVCQFINRGEVEVVTEVVVDRGDVLKGWENLLRRKPSSTSILVVTASPLFTITSYSFCLFDCRNNFFIDIRKFARTRNMHRTRTPAHTWYIRSTGRANIMWSSRPATPPLFTPSRMQ